MLLQCPQCREYAVAPLPIAEADDEVSHGCEVCGFKLKAFFVDSDAAKRLKRLATAHGGGA